MRRILPISLFLLALLAPSAGAVIGAVMKATRGQADAAVVRRLLLERLGVSE